MSSRRKSTTPCMVLPSDVVEERTGGTNEETVDEEDVKANEGAEEESIAGELGRAVVVVPAPPEAGTITSSSIYIMYKHHMRNELKSEFLP